jgi:hypothetical protein
MHGENARVQFVFLLIFCLAESTNFKVLSPTSFNLMTRPADAEVKPWAFLRHPTTGLPLSEVARPVEDIWRDALALGMKMYGTNEPDEDEEEEPVNCLDANFLALPGMVVRVGIGKATKTFDADGNITETVEPYSYYGLVTGCQRQWNTLTKSWNTHPTSGCAVQVLRFDTEPEEERIYLDNKVWISTLKLFNDDSKYSVLEIMTYDVLSVQNLVDMNIDIFYPYNNRVEFKLVKAVHKFSSDCVDGS